MSALEGVAVAFGIAAVLLTVRQNLWCWPLGIVNVSLFAWLFWRERLYADAGLQVVYVGLCLYGWWAWVRGGPDQSALVVSRGPRRVLGALGLAASLFALLLGATLKRATNADLPFWDAGTTAFSLAAQWMQARKWLENWPVWIGVDVVYVGMYLAKGLWPTAFLYAVFVFLAFLGWREWSRAIPSARCRPSSRSLAGRGRGSWW